jgi:hypothetical protein
MMKSISYSWRRVDTCKFIGCATSAPDESTPEAIVEFFYSSIGSKFLRVHLESSTCVEIFFLVIGFLSGARPALPMGVAPEAMMGCLQPIIDSNKSGLFHLSCLHNFCDTLLDSPPWNPGWADFYMSILMLGLILDSVCPKHILFDYKKGALFML